MTTPLTAGTQTQNGLVAESDFQYEAPDNTPTDSVNADADAFIKNLAANWGQESPEMEPDVPDEYRDPTDEVPETEGLVPDEPDEVEVEDPKVARSISRVVQRELAARQEREAADKTIAQLQALKAEVEGYSGVRDVKALAEQMAVDPFGAFKAIGQDPDTIIKLALAQQLGDKAPQALKDFAKDAGTKREIAALRNQLAQEAQARASQEYFNTTLSGAREYVGGFDKPEKAGSPKKVGDSTPTLALVAKADPDYVRDEIMEEIVSEAKRQAAVNPNGELISYAEAASRVEKRLSRIAKLLSVQNGKQGSAQSIARPARTAPPTAKSATKPIAPWMNRSTNIEEDGIQEALREYNRVEAERKARR